MAPKRDWDTLKLEFFASPTERLSDFLKRKLGPIRVDIGSIRRKTDGWVEERKEWRRKIAEEALQEISTNEKEKKKQAMLTVLNLAYKGMNQMAEKNTKVESKDVKNYWWIFRVENGLPTTNIHTESLDPKQAAEILDQHTKEQLERVRALKKKKK